MSKLSLRQLAQLREHQAESHWLASGKITRSTPSNVGELLAFTADNSWQGLIKLRDWFHHVAPDLAALSPQAYSSEQLQALFAATPRPLELTMKELSYQKLQVDGLIEAQQLPQRPMLCLATPSGEVWLRKLPDVDFSPPPTTEKRQLSALPLPLTFEIGTSQLSLKLLRKLAVGDVLLITNKTQRVSTQGTNIGRYQLNKLPEQQGNSIMIEKNQDDQEQYQEPGYEEIDDDDDDNAVVQEQQDPKKYGAPSDNEKTSLSSCANIPIKLTFVLHQQTITFEKLEEMYNQGQVITCRPEAEKHIDIKANGKLIARGELVHLDETKDKLGVVLTELHHPAS